MPKKVLLVDDEYAVLRAEEIKFSRAGFEVETAIDGDEAWQILQDTRPDVVVTDCQMPNVDGLELCTRIQGCERLAGVPIIMVTAKGFELSAEELRAQFGIRRVFVKPFSPREILTTAIELVEDECEESTLTS